MTGGLARLRLRVERLRARPSAWAGALLVALCASMLLAGGSGAARVPLAELPRALIDAAHPAHAILWDVRLPRVVVGALVGAALAVAGTLMQAAVRNPLADPGLTGVTAGAGLGGMLAIVLWPEHPVLVPMLAYAGSLLALAAVLGTAWGGARVAGPLRLVLSGVAVQAIIFSLLALVNFVFADRAPAFVAFTIGSLAGAGWDEAVRIVLPVAVGAGVALLFARTLDLLLLDDGSAGGLGLAVARARIGTACLAALLAAAAASAAGLVGFIGLVVPNWVRVVTGPTHRVLLPLSLLAGATLLVLADAAARTVAAPLELPVGALLALIGGPYFLWILWSRVG